MTHTPFVSNPCPATAIVFVSQNLFYGQLPHGGAFFDFSLVALENHIHALVLGAGLIGAGDYYHHLVAAGDAAQSCAQILAVAVAHHGIYPLLLCASGKGGVEGSVGLYLLALCGAAHGGVGKLEEAYQGPAAAAVVVDVEG